MGALTLGAGSTLSITGSSSPYGLSFGSTSVAGTDTVNVTAGGTGTLGSLNDAGAAATLRFNATGTGTVTLGAAATRLVNGNAVSLVGGILNLGVVGDLGTLAAVNEPSGASIMLGANQTFGSLSGAGSVDQSGFKLTVGSTNNLSSTFGGVIADASGGSGGFVKAHAVDRSLDEDGLVEERLHLQFGRELGLDGGKGRSHLVDDADGRSALALENSHEHSPPTVAANDVGLHREAVGHVGHALHVDGAPFTDLVDLTVGGSPHSVAVGDFNGDGRLDVVTTQQLSDTVSVLLGNGDGTFARPLVFAASGQNFTPQSMALGDVNGDGKLDLVIKSVSSLDSDAFQVGVLLGNGDGTFQKPILGAAQPGGSGDLALGDFNNDGRLDVAVADQLGASTGNLSVFAGNGDGSFQSLIRLDLLTGGNDPVGVAAADLNGDGVVDLVTTNASSGTVGVLVNTSTAPAPAGATTTTLGTSAPTVDFGQTVLLTATVHSQAGVPVGTVTFLDGTTVLGTAPVNSTGQATLGVSLDVGSHALTASFAGARGFGFADSTSAAVTETVNRAATTVALRSSLNPAVAGQAVSFTATVASVAPGAATPTGKVIFMDGNVVLETVGLGPDGTATFSTSFAAAGGHVITAAYAGDVFNFVASSQTLTEQVNAPTTHKATTTALAASVNPVRVGHAVTFTATVRDPSGTGTPTGTVTFFVGTTAVATVRLDANGQARIRGSFSVAGLSPSGRSTAATPSSTPAPSPSSSRSLGDAGRETGHAQRDRARPQADRADQLRAVRLHEGQQHHAGRFRDRPGGLPLRPLRPGHRLG
jgi:hypothetical protein